MRLFIDGESSQVAQLREAMLTHALGVALEIPGEYRWRPADATGCDAGRPSMLE